MTRSGQRAFAHLRRIPPRIWGLTLAATALLLLVLGVGDDRTAVFRVAITPVSHMPGQVALVFPGSRYDKYVGRGNLRVPPHGWELVRSGDATLVIARDPSEPVVITTTQDDPVPFDLLQRPDGGAANLDNGAGTSRHIVLRAPVESTLNLVAGGRYSAVPASATQSRFSMGTWVAASVLLFLLLAVIAVRLAPRPGEEELAAPAGAPPARWELAVLALPLLLVSVATLLAFYPGNVSFDGSLQWVQAAGRGELTAVLGYAATYLMRAGALVSPSPAPFLLLQCVAFALGVATVLRQLRWRGLPFGGALLVVLLLALTPQYPSFVTSLGKDPLCTIGLLFFAAALLAAFRPWPGGVPNCVLAGMAASALFAAFMRSNALPAVLLVLLLALWRLHRRGGDRRPAFAAGAVLVLAVAVPAVLGAAASREAGRTEDPAAPSGMLLHFYVYHLFSAASSGGIPLPPEDAALFHAIAPAEAWKKYECFMTDTTTISVGQALRLAPGAYEQYLRRNFVPMAQAVGRMVLRHPEVLLQRQACITSLLWHAGLGEVPFEATATLGYDGVDPRFPALAGESRGLWPAYARAFRRYVGVTENWRAFWLFWRPALPLALGLFITALYLARRRDTGVLLVAVMALLWVAVLMVAIPFPAYRYAYPPVLLMLLLSSLLFVRTAAARTAPAPAGAHTGISPAPGSGEVHAEVV